MGESTYYEIFDVSPDATSAEIKTAYRRITTKVHPDTGGSHALFRQVQEAYETLSDPTRRDAYDRSLKDQSSGNEDHEEDYDDHSGWERVDDPPPSASDSGSGHGPSNPGSGSSDAPNPPPPTGSSGGPWSSNPPPPDYRPGSYPVRTSTGAGGPPTFFGQHPSATVAMAGGALIFVGSATARLGGGGLIGLGFLSVLLGLVGLVGSRRARSRENLLRSELAPRSPGQRFASELFAGSRVVFGVLASVIVVLAIRNRGRSRSPSGRRRRR